jgi:hypothetical protein
MNATIVMVVVLIIMVVSGVAAYFLLYSGDEATPEVTKDVPEVTKDVPEVTADVPDVEVYADQEPVLEDDWYAELSEEEDSEEEVDERTTLYPGENLASGDDLLNACYRLVMQKDGNLVMYNVRKNSVIWATNTEGRGGTSLRMQPDGNLVMYADDSRVIWATNTEGRGGTSLRMQSDGNLVMYADDSRVIWASNTSSGPNVGCNAA